MKLINLRALYSLAGRAANYVWQCVTGYVSNAQRPEPLVDIPAMRKMTFLLKGAKRRAQLETVKRRSEKIISSSNQAGNHFNLHEPVEVIFRNPGPIIDDDPEGHLIGVRGTVIRVQYGHYGNVTPDEAEEHEIPMICQAVVRFDEEIYGTRTMAISNAARMRHQRTPRNTLSGIFRMLQQRLSINTGLIHKTPVTQTPAETNDNLALTVRGIISEHQVARAARQKPPTPYAEASSVRSASVSSLPKAAALRR